MYQDKNGNDVFVSNGLDPKFWATYRRKPGKAGMHRVKSKNLPERKTFEEAQRDLDRYALAHKLLEARDATEA